MNDRTYKIGIDARLWNETGVGRYIRNLVRELQHLDTKNQYILFGLSKDIQEIQFSIFNSQFSIVSADVRWHTMEEQIKLPKILEKENLDLMHFPYFSVPIGYKGKYILTIHDLILHHFPTGKASTHSNIIYWMKLQGYKYIISQAANNAEKIITVSNATKEEIVQHLHVPQERVVVTYEGTDAQILNPKSQISNKENKFQILNSKFFLYVGNAYPHKNLETLVEAFAVFCHPEHSEGSQSINRDSSLSAQNDIKLILVGKQDYFYSRLEEKVKKMGLEDVVLFRHDVRDEELAQLYAHALALVMPSLMEGFGLPILEAMKQHCLVVASDIPVFHEIAKDIPLYFHPTHVQELRNVLESIAKREIADEKDRKAKGKAQANKFSWGKMAEETLAVYQSSFGV